MKKIISILILVLLIGCNNNAKEEKTLVNNKAKEHFSVYISFKSNKPDNVKVSLKNISIDEFQTKTVTFQESIIPSKNYDEMKIVFDPNDNSKNVLINLGSENEKIFEIKNIKLSYGGKEIFVENAEGFKKHFAFNKFVELESGNKIKLITSKINGQHNPVIYVKTHFLNSLFKKD